MIKLFNKTLKLQFMIYSNFKYLLYLSKHGMNISDLFYILKMYYIIVLIQIYLYFNRKYLQHDEIS